MVMNAQPREKKTNTAQRPQGQVMVYSRSVNTSDQSSAKLFRMQISPTQSPGTTCETSIGRYETAVVGWT